MKGGIWHNEECYQIQGAVFDVYREMGCGFLEAVYQECLGVGRNKTTQAWPELVEGRSAWWRFRHYRTACRKRLFSLALEKPYSGLRGFWFSIFTFFIFEFGEVSYNKH